MRLGLFYKNAPEEELEKYEQLEERLVEIDGEELVYCPTSLLDEIVQRGHIFKPKEVHKVQGHRSECHNNSLELVLKFPEKYKMAHGFALSDDGLWRCHSWIAEGESILETTVSRIKYYGIVLDIDQAIAFTTG